VDPIAQDEVKYTVRMRGPYGERYESLRNFDAFECASIECYIASQRNLSTSVYKFIESSNVG
jgi:hypothetical protein